MPYIIYQRIKGFSSIVVGVCNAKDVTSLLANLNKNYKAYQESPRLKSLKDQADNLKNKRTRLNDQRARLDIKSVPEDFREIARKLFNDLAKLANGEVDRQIAEVQKNLSLVEREIKSIPNTEMFIDPPYYAVKVKVIKLT